MRYGLIVCDSSPLITLARAGELDLLLRHGLPVTIPDAVYREAANPNYDDGVMLMEWVERNAAHVRVASTQAGLQQDILLRNGVKANNLGEVAAMEVIDRFLAASPDQRAVLIYEDSDVRRLPTIDRADTVTTGAFLIALERAGLIQSADHILNEAARAGRNVEAQREGARGEPPAGLVSQLRDRPSVTTTGLLDVTPRSLKPPGSATLDADRLPLDRPRGGRSR